MTIEEAILEKVRTLPPAKKQEVLEFVGSLSEVNSPKRALKDPFGLWAEFDISISEEDIRELRQEMWKNFPRDDI